MEDVPRIGNYSVLADQAFDHIKQLTEIIDQLVASNKLDDACPLKKQQLADLTQMIKRWEAQNIPVSDELRLMQLSLTSDLGHERECANLLDRIRDSLKLVLHKIPGADSVATKRKRRHRVKGFAEQHVTSAAIFREQILKILKDFGGKTTSFEVRAEIEKRIGHQFTPRDKDTALDGKRIIWWTNAQWERLIMVKEGLLRKNSPRGIWELA